MAMDFNYILSFFINPFEINKSIIVLLLLCYLYRIFKWIYLKNYNGIRNILLSLCLHWKLNQNINRKTGVEH